MEPVVYHNDVVRRHSLWSVCGCLLNTDISNRDYPGADYFDSEIEALDMDTYETKICHGHADCTADAVIGVSACQNKKLSNHRLLLVELRMDYQSADNLSKSGMESKVTHTKQLLGAELPINRETVFVFTEKVAPQARHWVEVRKHEGGEILNFVVYSVKEFEQNVASYASQPYDAINKPEVLGAEFQAFKEKGDWQGLFSKIHFWLDYANKIHYSNVYEYENLRTIILSEWAAIRAEHPCFLEDDDEIEAQILEEDIDLIK